MKMRHLKFLLIFALIMGCSSDDNVNNCNLLVNVSVDVTIDLNLPQFNQLNFPGGVVPLDGEGNGGIFLIRVNNETILAWDGADPNFVLSSCSIMTLDGTNVRSSCNGGNEFSLFTGGPLGDNPPPCGLKAYRVLPIDASTFVITN